jgi:protocatechuate 3,4-dioxygenase beta subunit
MNEISRRVFLRKGAMGLAAAGATAASVHVLTLHCDAQVTPSSGTAPSNLPPLPANFVVTERNIEGPFFRPAAPFRAKITPPLANGTTLLIQGRVWGFGSKKPLAGAVLDIWQASAAGRYDNDDFNAPPAPNVFLNRARVITDENGAYEFETVHPGKYPLDETRLRPAHIHYRISHPAHKTLITQLYFKGDTHIEGDPFVVPSLIIELDKRKNGEATYEHGVFDIVLAPR